MAGPLGVTHLLLFSKSKESGNTNLRLALTPRGPTLHFRVESYSLCKDVGKSVKNASAGAGGGKQGKLHGSAPLLVMNNFVGAAAPTEDGGDRGKGKGKESGGNEIPRQLESLTTTIFQSLFPPISPQSTPLGSIRRIMLLNREVKGERDGEDVGAYTINLRHYAITTKRLGVSKRIRRLDPSGRGKDGVKQKGLPNLGKLDDVAEYLLDPAAGGYTSASESEVETDAEVEVLETETARKVPSRKEMERRKRGGKRVGGDRERNVERRAVKLVELGPRLKLRMVKVEEGVCGGKVMWHEFVKKSNMEVRDMDEMWEDRRKEKERRRTEQRENVERKRKEKGASAQKNGDGDVEGEMEDEEWDSEDMEDDEEDGGMELDENGQRS
jgi:ribosome biogenesis protein SSF1/2